MNQHILLVESDDQKGLVYKITKILFEAGLNIEKNSEFVDRVHNRFYMRTEVTGTVDVTEITSALTKALPKNTQIQLTHRRTKNIVLFATTESHCIGDLLIRHDSDDLSAEIVGVISNHASLESLVAKFNIPFHYVSDTGMDRKKHEELILKTLSKIYTKSPIDLIVLTKYMRVLTPDFVRQYKNKIVNIHHSFLPAFVGASPYKQAFERGVKIIGATAHFVTESLDEGPIIYQDVVHVTHDYTPSDMKRAGQNIEKSVLANALQLALEDRIFIAGNKTVIF